MLIPRPPGVALWVLAVPLLAIPLLTVALPRGVLGGGLWGGLPQVEGRTAGGVGLALIGGLWPACGAPLPRILLLHTEESASGAGG